MCGKLIAAPSLQDLVEKFNITRLGELTRTSPTQVPGDNILGFTDVGDQRVLSTFRWGIFPGETIAYNARLETADTRTAWAESWKTRRCVVPVQGYYEGSHVIDSDEIMPLAGLYRVYKHGDQYLRTVSILTTSANPFDRQSVRRMPVILPFDAITNWLNGDLATPEDVMSLMPSSLSVTPETAAFAS